MRSAAIAAPGTAELATVDDPAVGSRVTEVAVGARVAADPNLPDVLRSLLASHVLVYDAVTTGLMMLQLAKTTGDASIGTERLAMARPLGHSSSAMTADELQRPRHGRAIARCQAGAGRKIQIQPGLATA
ncbi:hypothetical protein [Streptomyces sp. NPDC054783]